ncbi:MAG: S-layer homology domain-containing protein, partial [Bacillota bacterium]|nr:S-layer homology domain-containing protein [Bacillota bacterium]
NDDSVQANDNWRHDPELNRSVHLATIKDKSYSKLIEELVNQFAFCLSSRDPELLDRKWMGDPAKTQETLDALIASCYCQHMPVVASDASVRNYVLQNGTVYDLTDGKKAFDVASTFKAYAFGEEIITNTDETDTFTYTYYADDNYSVGELLDGVPSEPGVYWAQAHLPGGNKYFKYDHYIYGKDFDDQIFYGTDAQGNYIYDKEDVPEEYIVRAGSDIMLNSSSTGRWYAPSNARGIVRFVISAADKTALKAQLEALSALKETDYTEKSWAVFAAAVEKAEGILDDIYADAAAVEAMQKELKQAEDYLFRRSDVASKSAIEGLLAYAAMLEKADYTAESWAALQAECSAALAVAENERAGKEEVAAAAASLEAAIDALEVASYTLYITSIGDGEAYVQGGGDDALLPVGSRVTLWASPDKDADFDYWYDLNSGEILSYSVMLPFTMPNSDVHLFAYFVNEKDGKDDADEEDEEESYTIKATVGKGGSIDQKAKEKVDEGDDITYVITPDEGYVIKDVLVDGKSVGAVDRYTFKDVDDDHEIEILFAAKAPEVIRYNPFYDIKEADWFYNDVLDSYALGLINGRTVNSYAPEGNITIAEAIKLAATMHQKYTSGAVTLSNGAEVWYSSYVDYAVANGIIKAGAYSDMNATATRAQFAMIFAAALPEAALPAINDVADGKIPDVKLADSCGAAVYKLYRAGILNGNDAAGSFSPASNIKRSEVAAIVNRMMNAEKRLTVTL